MIKCSLCKSKMPEKLFTPAFGIPDSKGLCPVCMMARRNQHLGLPLDTPFQGEIASGMVEEAWQYYRPKGEDIYKLNNTRKID